MKPAPLKSLWIYPLLAIGMAAPFVQATVRDAMTLDGLGSFMLITFFLPVRLAVLVALGIILYGLYKKSRAALIAYMISVPFGLVATIRLFAGSNPIANSVGYGTASSLVLTAFIILFAGLFGLIEYLAVRDLRTLKKVKT